MLVYTGMVSKDVLYLYSCLKFTRVPMFWTISELVVNMSSVIAQAISIWISYEWNIGLIYIDCISMENLDTCLDQGNIKLDLNYWVFTLVLINNLLLYEGSTIIDSSLIIGNQIDTFLCGFLVVFSLYFELGRHL